MHIVTFRKRSLVILFVAILIFVCGFLTYKIIDNNQNKTTLNDNSSSQKNNSQIQKVNEIQTKINEVIKSDSTDKQELLDQYRSELKHYSDRH